MLILLASFDAGGVCSPWWSCFVCLYGGYGVWSRFLFVFTVVTVYGGGGGVGVCTP